MTPVLVLRLDGLFLHPADFRSLISPQGRVNPYVAQIRFYVDFLAKIGGNPYTNGAYWQDSFRTRS